MDNEGALNSVAPQVSVDKCGSAESLLSVSVVVPVHNGPAVSSGALSLLRRRRSRILRLSVLTMGLPMGLLACLRTCECVGATFG